MADNIKPYDHNKGFISFRLNPDAIKEALMEQVPYNRTLRNIYNNPEGDIRETAKIAASETPFLGSLLSGDYGDAAKEAILLGFPIKAKTRAEINKLSPNTKFKYRQESWENNPSRIEYKDFDSGDYGTINENGLNPLRGGNHWDSYYDVDRATALKDIDISNSMYNKNSKHSIDTEYLPSIYVAKDYYKGKPYYDNPIGKEVLKEGDKLVDRFSERNYNNGKGSLEKLLESYNDAQKLKSTLKKSHTLYIDDFGNLYTKKSDGRYYYSGINYNGKPFIETNSENASDISGLRKYTDDPNILADYKQLQQDVKEYNAKYGFEDNFINMNPNDIPDWRGKVRDANKDYIDSYNGPFIEDILKLPRDWKEPF